MLGFSAIGQHAIAELIDFMPPLTYEPISRLTSSPAALYFKKTRLTGNEILWDDGSVILWDDGTPILFG